MGFYGNVLTLEANGIIINIKRREHIIEWLLFSNDA